jgi:hypothetical protein
MFAFLLEAFVGIKNKSKIYEFGTPVNINVKNLAEHLSHIASPNGNLRYFSDESFKSRIEVAVAMKKIWISKK